MFLTQNRKIFKSKKISKSIALNLKKKPTNKHMTIFLSNSSWSLEFLLIQWEPTSINVQWLKKKVSQSLSKQYTMWTKFCSLFTFYNTIHVLYVRLYTTKDILATIENFAWRDFKGRLPFDIVYLTEITGRVMFVNVELHYHRSLYIQLNSFPL